jgi:hypothetical protein
LLRPDLFAIRALEGVGLVGAEADLLRNIGKAFRDGEKEESVVKAVEECWSIASARSY